VKELDWHFPINTVDNFVLQKSYINYSFKVYTIFLFYFIEFLSNLRARKHSKMHLVNKNVRTLQIRRA
jgi:hypothetical protein